MSEKLNYSTFWDHRIPSAISKEFDLQTVRWQPGNAMKNFEFHSIQVVKTGPKHNSKTSRVAILSDFHYFSISKYYLRDFRTKRKYSSSCRWILSAGISQRGQTALAIPWFNLMKMLASKHWRCLHFLVRHGKLIRFWPEAKWQ